MKRFSGPTPRELKSGRHRAPQGWCTGSDTTTRVGWEDPRRPVQRGCKNKPGWIWNSAKVTQPKWLRARNKVTVTSEWVTRKLIMSDCCQWWEDCLQSDSSISGMSYFVYLSNFLRFQFHFVWITRQASRILGNSSIREMFFSLCEISAVSRNSSQIVRWLRFSVVNFSSPSSTFLIKQSSSMSNKCPPKKAPYLRAS